MNQNREKVNKIYQQLEQELKSNIFVLNKNTQKLYDELNEIQHNCQHNFVNGQCIYCDAFITEE